MSDNRKPRILMATTISKAFNWFVSDSAKNLSEKGFDVTVMCGEMDKDFIAKHEKFSTVKPLSIVRGMNPFAMLKSILEIRKIVKEGNFDIVQYSTPNVALCCALCPGFRKIPIRVYGQWGLRYVGFTGIKRKIFKAIEKLTCKSSTHIYAVSGKNRQFSIDEGLAQEDRIFVMGKGGTIGVDFSVYNLEKKDAFRESRRREFNISKDEFLFGFIGRLNRDKGVTELLTAFRAFSEEFPNAKLMLVGMEDTTCPPDAEYMAWAKSSDKVIFTGNVPPQDVPSYMSAMDILIHPTYREGFSMVLQEAMAMELPIITTDVPGPSEVIVEGKTGLLVPSHNPNAILKEMKALMSDGAKRTRFAHDGRRRVELFFARPVMLRNIYNKYCELLGIADRKIKLMYLTSEANAAKLAQDAGVDRIFLDLELLGKKERQGHLDTVVSNSSLEDVARLRRVLKDAELVVRCNPVHPELSKEIDSIIDDGADMIILPYFKETLEVKEFLDIVGGRVKTMLLFETAESAKCIDEILELSGIDEAYIGLNDLHLSYKKDFMFELLTDGTVEMLCEKFRNKGIPYGFGGLAKIGEGLLESEYIIPEHKRLGSTCAILSRTFRNEVDSSRPIDDLKREIELIRQRESETEKWSAEKLADNKALVEEKVLNILKNNKKTPTSR